MSRGTRVLLDGLRFPECPRWHDGRLWYSDQYEGVVRVIDLDGRDETIVEVPGAPAGLGWLPDGAMLVVSMEERRLLRYEDGALHALADLGPFVDGPCNDMVVDGHGRAYVGNFGFDLYGGAPMADATLVLVEPDGAARRVGSPLAFANGCVLTPDGHTLIVAETYASRLTAFDVAPDGTLSGRRLFAQLDGTTPDGISLDADGAVWVGSPFTGEFLRVGEGGAVLDRIDTPGRMAVACMLGGEDGRTLFLCTARATPEQMLRRESEGFVEAVEVDVPHAGLP